MSEYQNQAIGLIEQQQNGIENTAPWMVGEQLKDICRREPENAELIAHDLAVPEMSLVSAEKKIKAWADSQRKKGNSFCVPPNVAEDILRKFYGLKEPVAVHMAPVVPDAPKAGLVLDLADFL